MVRKAARPGYEFSGMYVLPGGLVRGGHPDGFGGALRASLRGRVHEEAGVDLSASRLEPLPVRPATTSYHARGEKRHTWVLAFQTTVDQPVEAVAGHDSVFGAKWVDESELPWRRFAPANRLLLGSALWGSLTERVRKELRPMLSEDRERSLTNAAEVGIPASGGAPA